MTHSTEAARIAGRAAKAVAVYVATVAAALGTTTLIFSFVAWDWLNPFGPGHDMELWRGICAWISVLGPIYYLSLPIKYQRGSR